MTKQVETQADTIPPWQLPHPKNIGDWYFTPPPRYALDAAEIKLVGCTDRRNRDG
jgi:hypothetical protein